MVPDLMWVRVSSSDSNEFGKRVIIFLANRNSSSLVDNRKKNILILRKGPVQGLDDTRLTAEKEHAINFTEQHKKFCLSLHCNGIYSYLFINDVEIIQTQN